MKKCEFFGPNFDKAVVQLKDGTRVSQLVIIPLGTNVHLGQID